ncbi:DoxX family protein [Crossiella sp. CA-258035]|uniref:DoxX family protein n=1 Tax=Crossiella sp. CA-258035 TaxID=2981138 RepID=UPI0024BCA6ED|nr:DoxX family protein [Crossiella sp. CA-258035]WHT19582.1 DoxX family protein [Crossiella sp. CA-258035]
MNRNLNIGLWIAQGLIAALFLFGAYPKLTGEPMVVAGFAAMGLGEGMVVFVGLCELAGAIGILVPVLTRWAALGLVALLIGAVILGVSAGGPAAALFPGATLLVVAGVAWGRWSAPRGHQA